MPLVWVTGNAGVGKSTVCALLKSRGVAAIDADQEGYCHWADRMTGRIIPDPPSPTPRGWLEHCAWRINRGAVKDLAGTMRHTTAFLCGSAENGDEVWDLFDRMVCLVADKETIEVRLGTRTTNPFGQHPEELAAALEGNEAVEATYRRLGATIIDGTRPPPEVADRIIAAAAVDLPRPAR